MADPKFPPFLVQLLSYQKSNPKIPDEFFTAQGKNDLMKVKLTSDASDKTWLVKLNGRRLAAGWEDFSTAHRLRNDDVLVFRHEGDMVFHVSASGRSFSELRKVSSSSGGSEEDEDGEDNDSDSKNIRSKKRSRIQRKSSSFENSCLANKLKTGYQYRFKLVENGTRPVLQLWSDIIPEGNGSKSEGKVNVSAKFSGESGSASGKQNKFLTVTFKPCMLQSRRFYLPKKFTRVNGIKEAGDITLVDKTGFQWPSYLASPKREEFYMTKNWLRFCEANGFQNGETFKLEFVPRHGSTPMFKFCSSVKIGHILLDGPDEEEEVAQEETETQVHKRARVSEEGGPSRRSRSSNNPSADPSNLLHKQPFEPCSISVQLTKVKQNIMDTLTGLSRFRSEVEIKETNLKATLLGNRRIREKSI